MAKQYVRIGIDHGTTNSCIAVMDGDRPRVIQPAPTEKVMPSAVYIDRRGRRFIGAAARKSMMETGREDGNGHTGYKIRIGQDDRYEFSAARQVMTAPDLGAIVIGELLRYYREETDDDPKAAVITVPAKFEQSACDGTRKAARQAGLLYCPLLQEPIAAALAYGFTMEDERAQWVVFDLGGGTLDVSLVIVRRGQMVVPEDGHAGDTRLGGRKFDREVMAYVLEELSKEYALKSFTEENKQYSTAWGTLMLAIEEAKIELSRKQSSVVEVDGELCRDERGKPVKVEVPVTRAQYEKMIAADVEKAVHLCQNLLTKNRLSPRDVSRLILVGGPTKTPYLQQVLHERLNIPLDDSIDPMTAVALGAALYATTTEIPEEVAGQIAVAEAPAAGVSVKLEYERRSNLPTYSVAGAVQGAEAAGAGLTVELRRTDGLWSSGRLPVDESGLFSAEVLLIDGGRPTPSRFRTDVLDAAGKTIASADEIEIWYPFPKVDPRLANSLLIAVKGNMTEVLVEQGAALPAHGRGNFVTQKNIRRGSKDDVLRIAVLEAVTHLLGGEDRHADCNVHVGTLVIEGSNEKVVSDIPAGSEIEVSLTQDESREIHATAYVGLLEDEFAAEFKYESFDIDLEEFAERFERLKRVLKESEQIQREHPLPEVEEALAVIRRLDVVESVGKELERAGAGERDARYRAYRGGLELAGALNQIVRMQTRPRIRRNIDRLRPNVQNGEGEELAGVERDYGAVAPDAGPDELAAIEERLDDLDIKVRRRPLYDLVLDYQSFPQTFRGNEEQLAAFREAEEIIRQLSDSPHDESNFSQSMIDRATASHRRLMRAWPDLPAWRQKKLAELAAGGRSINDLGADIAKAGPRTR